jgi:membrane protease YdiL (CAAX protease family)
MINRRIDPALDRRRLILFFAGLIVFYVGVLLITRPVLNGGEAELNKFVIGVMLAPTVGAILACVFALGEEIGWRGFLWPLMRRRLTFLASTAIMTAVWWIYHAGLTFAGWYGFIGGIPAFTVGLLGFVLSSA